MSLASRQILATGKQGLSILMENNAVHYNLSRLEFLQEQYQQVPPDFCKFYL